MTPAPCIVGRFYLQFPKMTLDVSLSSQTGRLALFGPSGAGKTTVLKMIAGLAKADSALLAIEGQIWDDPEEDDHVPSHLRRAAMVFQDDRLFPHMSVRHNLTYGYHASGDDRLNRLIEMTGISDLLSRSVHTLSGGERKRVAIARALASSPRLLLLDEPYVGLDRATARKLRQDMRMLLEELALPHVIVSHHLDDVLAHAAEVTLIEDGKDIGTGSPDTIFDSANGQRLIGAADETLAGGPLSILKVKAGDTSPGGGLHRWYFENGLELLLPTSAHHALEGYVKFRGADIALSRQEPAQTSVLNVFQGRAAEIELHDSFADVRLDLGAGVFLTSRITSYSASQLGLQQGERLYAMIKSAALAI